MADEHSDNGAVARRHERPEDWGWHGTFPRATRLFGWLVAAFLLLLMVGNHYGNMQDYWLIGLAALIVVGQIWDWRRRKNAWRGE